MKWTLFSEKKPEKSKHILYMSTVTGRLVSEQWAELNPDTVKWCIASRRGRKKRETELTITSMAIEKEVWDAVPKPKGDFATTAIMEKLDREGIQIAKKQ